MKRSRTGRIPAAGGVPAYLDIETAFDGSLTVVGMMRPDRGLVQLVGRKITAEAVSGFLAGAAVLHTYNGDRFDLPRIRGALGLDVGALVPSDDLMKRCHRLGLKGGLKRVEVALGIGRTTAGLNGMDAMKLWARYVDVDDGESLDTLLRYNRDDVENLAALRERLENLEGAGRIQAPAR